MSDLLLQLMRKSRIHGCVLEILFFGKKDKSFSLCCACFPSRWQSSVDGLIAENLVA